MRHHSTSLPDPGTAYRPLEFEYDLDVADCALDEEVEQLQRQHAAATRAVSRARYELELLEKGSEVHPIAIAQAALRRVAAEIRSARLMRAIATLEKRLEIE